jgi:plasmid maintenance system antidote protein VapI
MSREDPHFRLRLPVGLKQQVETAAKTNSRSVTAEVVDRLEKSFGQPLEEGGDLLSEIDSIQQRIANLRIALTKIGLSS